MRRNGVGAAVGCDIGTMDGVPSWFLEWEE
jgi:hypothetical protein